MWEKDFFSLKETCYKLVYKKFLKHPSKGIALLRLLINLILPKVQDLESKILHFILWEISYAQSYLHFFSPQIFTFQFKNSFYILKIQVIEVHTIVKQVVDIKRILEVYLYFSKGSTFCLPEELYKTFNIFKNEMEIFLIRNCDSIHLWVKIRKIRMWKTRFGVVSL